MRRKLKSLTGMREPTEEELKAYMTAEHEREFEEREGRKMTDDEKRTFGNTWEYAYDLFGSGIHIVLPNGQIVSKSDYQQGKVR